MKQRGRNRSSKVLSLDDRFPGAEDSIRKLRRKNAEFDSICRDFEIILNELDFLSEDQQESQRSHKQQLLESIGGLQKEIAAFLRSAGNGLPDKNFRNEDDPISHSKS